MKFSPKIWSTEGKENLDFFTNNGIESYHNKIARLCNILHPNVLHITHILEIYSKDVFARIESGKFKNEIKYSTKLTSLDMESKFNRAISRYQVKRSK